VSERAFPVPPGDHRPQRPPEVLRGDECWKLIRGESVGRLGFVVDGWPVVLPMNYCVDGEEIILRTGPGAMLASAQCAEQVSLQVDAIDSLYRSGWSVLVLGVAEEIIQADELDRLRSLALRSWAGGERRHWVRMRPIQITGRRLPRAWQYPGAID